MRKKLVLNYVFELMLRFNDVSIKHKIMHGKRMMCQCTEMVIYYSIATNSAFKQSLQIPIIFSLYFKGSSETERTAGFPNDKGKIFHMKNNYPSNFSRMNILILEVNKLIVLFIPENARVTQMIYKLHQTAFYLA